MIRFLKAAAVATFVVVFGSQAMAASVVVEPASGSVDVGGTITVSVRSSQGNVGSVVEAQLLFSDPTLVASVTPTVTATANVFGFPNAQCVGTASCRVGVADGADAGVTLAANQEFGTLAITVTGPGTLSLIVGAVGGIDGNVAGGGDWENYGATVATIVVGGGGDVPEPATMLLLGLGLAGLSQIRRRAA